MSTSTSDSTLMDTQLTEILQCHELDCPACNSTILLNIDIKTRQTIPCPYCNKTIEIDSDLVTEVGVYGSKTYDSRPSVSRRGKCGGGKSDPRHATNKANQKDACTNTELETNIANGTKSETGLVHETDVATKYDQEIDDNDNATHNKQKLKPDRASSEINESEDDQTPQKQLTKPNQTSNEIDENHGGTLAIDTEITCNVCHKESSQAELQGLVYCCSCVQRLCPTCSDIHSRLGSSRHHSTDKCSPFTISLDMAIINKLCSNTLDVTAKELATYLGLQVCVHYESQTLEILAESREVLIIAKATVEFMLDPAPNQAPYIRRIHNQHIEWVLQKELAVVIVNLYEEDIKKLVDEYETLSCSIHKLDRELKFQVDKDTGDYSIVKSEKGEHEVDKDAGSYCVDVTNKEQKSDVNKDTDKYTKFTSDKEIKSGENKDTSTHSSQATYNKPTKSLEHVELPKTKSPNSKSETENQHPAEIDPTDIKQLRLIGLDQQSLQKFKVTFKVPVPLENAKEINDEIDQLVEKARNLSEIDVPIEWPMENTDRAKLSGYMMEKDRGAVCLVEQMADYSYQLVIKAEDEETCDKTRQEILQLFHQEGNQPTLEQQDTNSSEDKKVDQSDSQVMVLETDNPPASQVLTLPVPKPRQVVMSTQTRKSDQTSKLSTVHNRSPRVKSQSPRKSHQSLKIPKYIINRWKRSSGGLRRLRSTIENSFGLEVAGTEENMKIYGHNLDILELAVQTLDKENSEIVGSGVAKRPVNHSVKSGVTKKLADQSEKPGVTKRLADPSEKPEITQKLADQSVKSGDTKRLGESGVTKKFADQSIESGFTKRLADRLVEWRLRGDFAHIAYFLFSDELCIMRKKFKSLTINAFTDITPAIVDIKCDFDEYTKVNYQMEELENSIKTLYTDEYIQPKNFYYNIKVQEYLRSKRRDRKVHCVVIEKNNLNVIVIKSRCKEYIQSAKDQLSSW